MNGHAAWKSREKDTFIHFKESMTKIFGDRRVVWQKQTDFFALKQGKDQNVLDFSSTMKQHQGKAEVGPGTVLAIFFRRVKGTLHQITRCANYE